MISNFYSVVNRPPSFKAPCGDRIKKTFQLDVDPDGRKILRETGVVDVYEQIQSYKEECLIENIVKRALAGDPTALAKTQGVYCDTTLIPKDLISAHEAVRQAESIYKRLSPDVRGQFASFKEFVDQFGTLDKINEFYAKLTNAKARSEEPPSSNSTNEGGAADAS